MTTRRFDLAPWLLFAVILSAGCSLTVTKAGSGTGTVTSAPHTGIACGSVCTTTFVWPTNVNLTAAPDSGSTFVGWNGACSGSGTCSLYMDASKSIAAAFRRLTVSAGVQHTCAVRLNGTVACWGRNSDNQLGSGSTVAYSTTALSVVGIPTASGATAIAVAAGGFHTCALLSDGTVQCWGLNDNGQLGNGSTVRSSGTPVPVLISPTPGVTAVGIAAGGHHSCAVLSDGTLRCWGHNANYQLDGLLRQNFSGVPVTPKGITTATAVTAGAYHTCALLAGGSMRCWGFNADGQLGNGQTDERNVSIVVVGSAPSIYPVRGLPGSVTAIAGAVGAGVMGLASFGGYHTCALIAGGAVSCWGYGGNGQLGNGSTANSNVPVAVSGITTAIAIAAGAYHSCALLADGTARCWGRNGDGELGDRANSDSTSPVTVFALSRVKEITAGGFHTCAVLTTPGPPGQIWCWGQNNNGELGTGTTSPSNRPVPISGF